MYETVLHSVSSVTGRIHFEANDCHYPSPCYLGAIAITAALTGCTGATTDASVTSSTVSTSSEASLTGDQAASASSEAVAAQEAAEKAAAAEVAGDKAAADKAAADKKAAEQAAAEQAAGEQAAAEQAAGDAQEESQRDRILREGFTDESGTSYSPETVRRGLDQLASSQAIWCPVTFVAEPSAARLRRPAKFSNRTSRPTSRDRESPTRNGKLGNAKSLRTLPA